LEYAQEAWDESHTGGLLSLSRRILKNRLSLGFTYDLRNVRIFDAASAPLDVQNLAGNNLVSAVRADASWNTRDHNFHPSTGWYIKTGSSLAGGIFGGDHAFYKLDVDARRYFPLYHTRTLSRHHASYAVALELRARAAAVNGYGSGADDSVPFFERFTAGGIGTLRGFDYRTVGPKENNVPIGGKVRLLGSAEVTFPLQENAIRGGIFLEAGNVWTEDNEVELDWNDLKKSWGVGLQILTPLSPLPIKIYWAWIIDQKPGDDSERVSFTFGFPF
jgi:outer membrane protein insertion porin family